MTRLAKNSIPDSWRIEMLGGLRITLPGEMPYDIPPQRGSALLAFLALRPNRQHTRDELAAMFWPEEEPAVARHRLRHTLHLLRRQLEQPPLPPDSLFITTRTTVRINEALIQTDVAEFETAVAAGAAATEPVTRVKFLSEAVALYRGPLLPGYYEEELHAEQQRLIDLFWKALTQLVRAYEDAGDLDRALETARRAVSIDPLSEEAHCALMRMYARTGQPSAMLRQYQEMERVLQEQLGIAPSLEVCALVETLRKNGNQDAPSAQPPVRDPDALRPDSDRAAVADAALTQAAGARPIAQPSDPAPVAVASPSPAAPLPAAKRRAPAWTRWAAPVVALLLVNGTILFLVMRNLRPPAAPTPASRQINETKWWQYPLAADETGSEPTAMVIGDDGSIYVTGFVQTLPTSKRDTDIVTMKFSPDSTRIAHNYFNGPGKDVDRPHSIALDAEGNIYVAGEAEYGHGNGATRLSGLDYVLIKYDRDLNEVWVRHYDGEGHGEDRAQKVVVDKSGCAIVAGYSWIPHGPPGKPGFECVTVKYSPDGTRLWVNKFPGMGREAYAYDMAVDNGGSVYIAGVTRTVGKFPSNMDVLAMRVSPDGRRLWWHAIDEGWHGADEARAVCLVDGGPIFGGTGYGGNRANRGTELDYFLVHCSPDGDNLTQTGLNGSGFADDHLMAMAVGPEGSTLVTGELSTVENSLDFGTNKLTASGRGSWSSMYNSPRSDNDSGIAIAMAPDGQVFVTGKSQGGEYRDNGTCFDVVTLKYDGKTGKPLWCSRFNGPGSRDDVPAAIACDAAGNVYVAARSYVTDKISNTIILKYPANP